jgi:hypothetical protein
MFKDEATTPAGDDSGHEIQWEEKEKKHIFYAREHAMTNGSFGDVVRSHSTFSNLCDTKGRPLNTTDHYMILKSSPALPVRMLDAGAPRWKDEAPLRIEEGARMTFEHRGTGIWAGRIIAIRCVDYQKYRYLGTNSFGGGDYPHWRKIDWDSEAMFEAASSANTYYLWTQ